MNNIIKRVWNQNRMVNIEDLSGMAFQAEDGGHTFEISGVNDAGESVSLSGTVAGVFMRPDGADVALTGTASDGVVSVSLSDACYAVAGRFGLTIFVTADSKKTCVYACVGTIAQTSYGTVAGDTPQDVIDLINAINASIASIPADYTDLLDSIAPSFSDSAAYTTDMIVWYNGLLYQFTADKAAGSWDATKVRQISVSTTLYKMGQDAADVLFDDAELPDPLNAWIRYSNGEKVSSPSTNLYVFKGVLPKSIKAFLTSDSNVLCAIAFYTTDDISTDGYMQSESVGFPRGIHNDGLWYYATVPETCKTIAIVTKKPSDSVADSVILFDSTSVLRSDLIYTENVIDNLPYMKQSQYIRYSDGKNIGSGTYFRWYSIPNNGITKIKAQLYSGDTIPAVIAFYTSDFNADTVGAIDTSTYLQSASVRAINGWNNYEADVPTECKTILICTRTDNTSHVPSVQFLNNEIGALAYCFSTKKIADVNSQIEAINQTIKTQSPFTENMCFDHLFVNQVTDAFTSNIIIPCQSIFGVQVSARLGFKYIEANVHKTSDGKYVVTHGISGKLGNDFETLSGEPCSDVVINQTTFSNLRNNYRYRSSYAKYRVPIASLEEICYECKRYGMGIVLQYVDAAELLIARGIIGDNIILYNGNRTVWNGYIMEFLGYSTKDEILARCRTIGTPYMYNMSNPQTFTDAQLKEIVDALHNEGFLIGFVGAYQNDTNISRYINLGFDFNASGKQVNDFENGNVYDLCGDLDYTGITHTGTVENGVLHLADGQYIRLTGDANFLTKISMHITFSGKLYFDSVDSGVYIESDGSNSVWNSRFFLNTEPIYKLVSQGDTYIKNITVKASKC